MTRKKRLTIATLALLTAASFTSAISTTLSWIISTNSISMRNSKGYTLGAYFARGNGSENDPYIINAPVHLYNFAWLQYIGNFNQTDEDGNIETVYLKLEADINLTGTEYAKLPPIGTAENPFVGNFDGNGKTITGLKTCNDLGSGDNQILRKPSTVESLSNVNIMGVFGVIGSYNGSPSTAKYDTSANEVKNFNIKNYTLASSSTNLLCGAVAGYVNGPITDVAVSNSGDGVKFDVANGTTKLGDNTNISEYGLVGYADAKYTKNIGEKSVNIYNSYVEHDLAHYSESGNEEGWGGSIGMDKLFNRVDAYRQDGGHKTTFQMPREITGEKRYFVNGTEDVTQRQYEYTDAENTKSTQWKDTDYPLKGKVTFGQTEANYLWGTRTHTRDYTITNFNSSAASYIYLKSGNYYLYFTGGDASRTTDITIATRLYADNNDFVYYTYNNTNYYLYVSSIPSWNSNNKTLSSSTSKKNYLFKVDNGMLRAYNTSGTAQNGYINYGSSKFRVSTSGTANMIKESSTDPLPDSVTVDHVIEHKTEGTYLPLNVYENANEVTDADKALFPDENLDTNTAKPSNTGYLVGGTKDQSDNYGSGVRLASNYHYSDISRALGGSSSYSSSALQVITRTWKSNGITFVSDDYNSNTPLSSNLTSLSYVNDANKHNYADLGLEKYKDSRKQLNDQFTANTSNLYVLRFNEFEVNRNNTVIADKVLINKQIKTNYELPESCIDFNLKEKGYINFFGGAFRGSSNVDCFFSINHIQRDSNDTIVSMKKLDKIYGCDTNKKAPYYYQYKDGTYSAWDSENRAYVTVSGIPQGQDYSIHFDMKWVEEPGFTSVDNTVWYLEVPVNPGEYALGSATNTKTSTGGYIFYLDVGASSQQSHRTFVWDKYSIETRTYTIPLGVYFLNDVEEERTENKTLCITLKDGYTGIVVINGTEDLTEISRYDNSIELNFKEHDMVVKKAGEDPPLAVIPKQTELVSVERATYIDYLTDLPETRFVSTSTTTTVNGVTSGPVKETVFIDGDIVETMEDDDFIEPFSANVTDILFDLWFYYIDDDTIELSIGFTVVQDESDTEHTYYLVENHTVDITVGSDITVHVIKLENGDYGLVVNGTLVTTIGDVTVTATSEAPETPVEP